MELNDLIEKEKEIKKEKERIIEALGLNQTSPQQEKTLTGYEKFKGKNVFIRSVTHHYMGHVIDVNSMTLTLEKASWVPNDGRFNEMLKDLSKIEEIEPYKNNPDIGLGAILDIVEIDDLIQEIR